MVLLNLNQAYPLFDSAAATEVEGTPVALPVRCTTLTWQTVFGTEPSAVEITLLASLNGVDFIEIDDSTVTDGDLQTVEGNFTHLRADITSIADGADVTVLVVPKDL